MNDIIYFLFLDEIYSPNLNDFRKLSKRAIFEHKNHRHFGVAGVIMAASSLYDFYSKSNRIKKRYFSNKDNLIFHYIDILHKRNDYLQLLTNKKLALSFTSSLESFIKDSEFKYTCVFVDKHELIKKYGIFDKEGKITKIKRIGSNLFPKSRFIDYNLYLLCLRRLASFYGFISNRRYAVRGIIVAEARGKREDTELRGAFQKIYNYGILSIKPTDLRRVILDLFIVPKTQNYVGTQIADMVLYPTYDSLVPFHTPREDHFIVFEKYLEKKLINEKVSIIP
jgi:hypothetical protein